MKRRPAPPNPPRASAQRGSFLLEALISVLIVALGLLGLIGLQARAIQNVDDAQYRAEAAYLANALLGQMWVHDPKTAQLMADFDDTAGGPNYTEFKAWAAQRLPGRQHPRQCSQGDRHAGPHATGHRRAHPDLLAGARRARRLARAQVRNRRHGGR